jgi:sulfite exporter TauE/SafE
MRAMELTAHADAGMPQVGVSIMIIGLNGIQEAKEWSVEHEGPTEVAKQHSVEVALAQPARAPSVLSTLLTGILHGCSGSGHLLGVLPALTMPSWRTATTYLVAFGLGTMAAMSIFTAVVGEISSQMSERLEDPSTPGKLAFASSLFALVMGTLWTGKALGSMGVVRSLSRRLFAAA